MIWLGITIGLAVGIALGYWVGYNKSYWRWMDYLLYEKRRKR